MKSVIRSIFFLVILSSCRKENQNTIPDPPEGTYEVILYDQEDNVVYTRKGENAFYGVLNNGTQIRLDDTESAHSSSTDPTDAAYISFQLNYILKSAGSVDTSSFYGFLWQGRVIDDWEYKTKTVELKVTEIAPGKIKGEFFMNVASESKPNPTWGNNIKIKGKFYARCGGHGC